MEAIKLDIVTAVKLINDAIEERGEDYVYPKEPGRDCLYVHTDPVWDPDEERYVYSEGTTPGCLVGLAFAKAGVPLEEFAPFEGSDAEALIDGFEAEGIVTDVDPKAKNLLYRAQFLQDGGSSWGQARKAAYAESLGCNPDGTMIDGN